MSISKPLFLSENIRLGPIDQENDAAVESRWTHDAIFLRMISPEPAMPLSAAQIRKRYGEIEKSQEQDGRLVYFTLRLRETDRLIGFVELSVESWIHQDAWVGIGIGERADWGKGYGTDAIQVILSFAFCELNLQRVSLDAFSYNPRAIRSYEKVGFVHEGRGRGMISKDGKRYDLVFMGILREEWMAIYRPEEK